MTARAPLPLPRALTDRYRIIGECGHGATSVVYRARDEEAGREVAVKVLRGEVASTVGAERFLREVRIVAAIRHPNIVSLLDSGEAEGVLYCVLSFVNGETLRQRMAREGPLPVAEALRIARDIGAALSHAHREGIIHRDVKPENVLLQDGRALLSDFGIARAIVVAAGERVTDSGIAIGTPAYMSPEQALASSALDARTDQYSLAVCLYEMLAGDPPFAGRTSQALIARQVNEAPPRLEVARPATPPAVVGAVERALAKTPADRFASVDAFIAALDAPDSTFSRGVPRRGRARTVGTAAGALAVAGLGLWFVMNRRQTLDPSRVMVFPARTSASASDPDAGLRIADVIQIAVEHTDPLRWIPAWEDLDDSTRRDPGRLQARAARDIARRRGARYYLLSSTDASSGVTRVELRLYDAEHDSLVARRSAVDSTASASAYALVIQTLPALLASMLDPRERVDLTPLSNRKPAAIVRLLEAEEAYRTARFGAALELYRQAVAEDSLFAFAALKGAQAASWINRLEEATDLVGVAKANENMLPPRYRPYLRGVGAYLAGRADEAVAGFREALATDRYWAEAATALGDAFYHLLPSAAPLDSLAEAAFDNAFSIDSSFTPPLFHLAEIAIRRGERERAEGFLRRLRREGAEAGWSRHLSVMLRCLEPRPPRGEWTELARGAPDVALLAAKSLSGGARQAGCAAAGFRAVLRAPDVPVGTAWAAALGLHGTLAALGRADEAAHLLDSIRTTISVRALAFALIDVYADSAFRPQAEAAESFGRTTFGPDYANASPRTSWAFGVWEAWKGNRAGVDAIARRVAGQTETRPGPITSFAAASLAAHAALAAGDTATALRRFAALSVHAPRDSVLWEYLEPMAVDRLVHARLLLAVRQPAQALAVASAFDHQGPISFLAFVRPSLDLRIRAAERLGLSALAAQLRARLQALDGSTR